jgi:hypothetical protein
MTETQPNPEMDAYYQRTRRPLLRTPTTRLGKIGCGLLLVLWVCFLLLPFVMFWLASGRSITIPHGNIPAAEQYPRLQLALIMSQDNRGLQIINTRVQRQSSTNLCIEAHVNYLLWASAEEQNAAIYCDCYERPDADGAWVFVETVNTTCSP